MGRHEMGTWDDLKKRLKVYYASEGVVKKPKTRDLDRFERESGFKLPDDYREYARTFGSGTLGKGWQISTPGFADADDGDVDLARFNHRFSDRRFVRFCVKEDFHGWFAWDPEDVTDAVRHHYGIYLLGGPQGEDPDAPPIKVAPSFHEFIMSYALGGGFERQQGDGGTGEADGPILPEIVGFSQVIS